MTFFGPEIGSGFGELRHTPTKNSQEYPPGKVIWAPGSIICRERPCISLNLKKDTITINYDKSWVL